jgi:hypothetical protein
MYHLGCDAIYSAMSSPTFRRNRHYFLENSALHRHCCENLKSNTEVAYLNAAPFCSYCSLVL